ncbi:TPA: hypothetical protein DIV48_00065 [Candidatus Kaiserbacteria bacterium]|nr:MAG: hypothetical protein UY93_C0002G0177 [Parcubacteria group bacterium GW2011_GWA1_56_13]KKW46771.1 MAG: hypothetical protein UY97_C0003G0045 [Parcubacteria group bacterium GW2011_GWB1_57_6]HCR52027.1 hypothetical protein [Candidatus Kaiserbacteria bacterium]
MNQHLNPGKTGLAVGKLVGGVHLIWAILVAFGWAQALVNFSLWAHMVSAPVVVKAFDLSAAVVLVIVATAVGCVIGYAFAKIWNWLHR